MNRKLTEDLHQYFSQKENLTPDENYLLLKLIGELPYFQITCVSREDLENKGFDTSHVDDTEMDTLASKMSDDYCTQLFWESMDSIAEDYVEIPKYVCPKCGKGASCFDTHSKSCCCSSCDKSWKIEEPTGKYVLVEFPEDSSFFEEHEMGYPCFSSDDNGAMYVPEHLYKTHFDKDPSPDKIMIPVMWPESQKYFEPEYAPKRCDPIVADLNTLNDFGSSAIWVPLCLIDKK